MKNTQNTKVFLDKFLANFVQFITKFNGTKKLLYVPTRADRQIPAVRQGDYFFFQQEIN